MRAFPEHHTITKKIDNRRKTMEASVASGPRTTRLMGFLQFDPDNVRLLEDAALAAFEERCPELAAELLMRLAQFGPLSPALRNVQGLIAMALHHHEEAASIFASLLAEGDDPGLRFNLAWSKAMLGSYQEALDLLDDAAVAVSPRGPSLKILMMHHLDLYEEALACGEELVQRHPDDEALMGALATLAIDAEKQDLAAFYGAKAGNQPEGRVALGVLALGEQKTEESLRLFEEALAKQPNNARALVGKGLGLLALGQIDDGAHAIDKGAELFGDHLGSWVASGWAHFTRGDYAKARTSFERAEAADDTFAETHGGLAVLAILEGNEAEGRRRCEIARRLDKNCFGAALAAILLLEKSGNKAAAQRIRDAAMGMPVGPGGQTLTQAIAGFMATKPKT